MEYTETDATAFLNKMSAEFPKDVEALQWFISRLLDEVKILDALRAGGVDNWEWYETSMG